MYDASFDEPCGIEVIRAPQASSPDSEGTGGALRAVCIPESAWGVTVLYRDEACTDAVAAGATALGAIAVERGWGSTQVHAGYLPPNGSEVLAVRTVEGAIEHDGALYTRQGDGCVEYGLAAGTLHAVSPPLAEDTLVWGDVEVIALADGFELDFVRFDDGATGAVPWSQAFRTVPNLSRSGWWPSLTYSESAYSQHEDCSDRLLRAQYGAGTPYVSRWAQLEQGGFAEIGAPIADTTPLFAIDEGSGSCLPIAPSALERANLFAAQSSIAASQVPLAPAHGRVPAGALEFFALAGADLILEDAAYNDGQEWYDPALAVPCTPQSRSDGRWFCTPSGMDADAPPQGVTLVELVPE